MYRCCASLLSPSQADPKTEKLETTHTNNGSYMRRSSAGWFRYVSLLVGKGTSDNDRRLETPLPLV